MFNFSENSFQFSRWCSVPSILRFIVVSFFNARFSIVPKPLAKKEYSFLYVRSNNFEVIARWTKYILLISELSPMSHTQHIYELCVHVRMNVRSNKLPDKICVLDQSTQVIPWMAYSWDVFLFGFPANKVDVYFRYEERTWGKKDERGTAYR